MKEHFEYLFTKTCQHVSCKCNHAALQCTEEYHAFAKRDLRILLGLPFIFFQIVWAKGPWSFISIRTRCMLRNFTWRGPTYPPPPLVSQLVLASVGTCWPGARAGCPPTSCFQFCFYVLCSNTSVETGTSIPQNMPTLKNMMVDNECPHDARA